MDDELPFPALVMKMSRVTAYVDESLRLGGDGRYVLAAVVVPDARADDVRAALRSCLRRGQRRFHFRKQSDESRAAMCAVICGLHVDSLVVVAPVDPARQERARRRCLKALLWELDQRGVERVVFETRRGGDRLDADLIRFARRAGWVSQAMRYDFAAPDAECLLWLPDVIAGVTRLREYGDAALFDVVAGHVTVVAVPGHA